MIMPVMQVGIVGVTMHKPGVPVPMRVRFARWIGMRMLMLVMLVVIVPVLVLHQLMQMLVVVPLHQM